MLSGVSMLASPNVRAFPSLSTCCWIPSPPMLLPPPLRTLLGDDKGEEYRYEGGCSGKSMHKKESHPLAMQMLSQNESPSTQHTLKTCYLFQKKKGESLGRMSFSGTQEIHHLNMASKSFSFLLIRELSAHLSWDDFLRIRDSTG